MLVSVQYICVNILVNSKFCLFKSMSSDNSNFCENVNIYSLLVISIDLNMTNTLYKFNMIIKFESSNDYCLTSSEEFFSYIMARTSNSIEAMMVMMMSALY